MRILHVLDHSLPAQSGYVYRTLGILREQAALGWQTLQLTTPKQPVAHGLEETVDGWAFQRTPGGPSLPGMPRFLRECAGILATRRRLRALAEDWQPDILHAHSPVSNALAAMLVARQLNIPLVYEVRALWEDAAASHGTMRSGTPSFAAARHLETYAVRRADSVVTISRGLQDELARRRVAEDDLFLVPNAVDVERFAPEPGEAGTARQPGAAVGFVGSFYGYEGLDLLLEAAGPIVRDRPDTRFLLVGGGREDARLRELAAARNLGSHVTFAGWIPQEQITALYRDIDILVYPRRRNRLTELVTPLKPLEAMAMAKVVLASDVGGHRELIEDGRTGVLFKADDVSDLVARLSTLLDQRQNWPKIGMAARQFVERERTWKAVVPTYAQVYGRACARSRSPRGCDGDRPLRPAPD
jgi:glycogen(starch) synthase